MSNHDERETGVTAATTLDGRCQTIPPDEVDEKTQMDLTATEAGNEASMDNFGNVKDVAKKSDVRKDPHHELAVAIRA